MAGAFVRPRRWRRAIVWASAQRPDRPWRLAAAVCAFRGRWVARWRLVGIRAPEQLRRNLTVEGAEHLVAVEGGAILLEFHLGPPGVELPLRALRYEVRHVGWHDRPAGWWNEAWRPLLAPDDLSTAAEDPKKWPAVLYKARQTLLDGGKICIMADSEQGQEVFRIALPGGPMMIRPGWVTLHRLTGAPVLPVFTHLRGRTQIITIHPPLPTDESDPARRLESWQDIITSLVVDYVGRFPEQCPAQALVYRYE